MDKADKAGNVDKSDNAGKVDNAGNIDNTDNADTVDNLWTRLEAPVDNLWTVSAGSDTGKSDTDNVMQITPKLTGGRTGQRQHAPPYWT